ncbi:MAG: hypothetical protein JWP78_1361 [Mucilaginibacter sp.]|nr:hypothetical protein [Mucilaginibacter sp.]
MEFCNLKQLFSHQDRVILYGPLNTNDKPRAISNGYCAVYTCNCLEWHELKQIGILDENHAGKR